MAPDPHQGGDLASMAKSGTTIPSDAGTQRLIPSVPRPDQTTLPADGLGADSVAAAADNATDIPRGPGDGGPQGEVVTGTGDGLPGVVQTKNLHPQASNPAAKGHLRDEKHSS